MQHYRLLGFVISLIALVLALYWFDWKFTLVLWLALWANNLSMAARMAPRMPTSWEEE